MKDNSLGDKIPVLQCPGVDKVGDGKDLEGLARAEHRLQRVRAVVRVADRRPVEVDHLASQDSLVVVCPVLPSNS